MTSEAELEYIINRIPSRNEHPNSDLIITVPSSSNISASDISEIVSKYAIPKGWGQEEVHMTQKSGYFACGNCGRTCHIHVKSPELPKCPNCGSHNCKTTELEISFKLKE